MKRPRVTMPKWPAYLMGAFALACAYPAVTAPSPAAENYGVQPAKAAPIASGLVALAAAVVDKG